MAQGYNISVGLVDGITKPLAAINKKLMEIHAPVVRMQKQLSKFADLSGLTFVKNGFESIGRSAGKALGTLTSMLPVLGTLTGVASIAGIFKLAEGWASVGTQLKNTSMILGTSASKLLVFENAARLAGASAADVDASIQGLGQAMQTALSGGDSAGANLMLQYGLDIKSAGFQAKNGADQFVEALNAIKRAKDSGASAATVQNLAKALGISENLIPLAISGKLQEKMAEARKLNPMTDADAEKGDALRESITKVTIAAEGLGNALSVRLGPHLTKLMNQFSEWIATSPGLKKMIDDIGNWLDTVNFDDVIESIKGFVAQIREIIEGLGGWKLAAEGLFVLWTGAKLAAIADGLVAIGAALTNPLVLPALAVWAGFFAAKNTGTKSAEVSEMARQLGYTAGTTDDAGNLVSYNDREGKIRTPEDVQKDYKDSGGFSSGIKSGADTDKAAKQAWDFWKSKGMSDQAAAGMVAQEESESGFDPGQRGDGGTAHGSFQWHKDRRDKIFKGTGINVSNEHDPNKQREAAYWELTHGDETTAGGHLAGASSYRQGGEIGSREFERPGLTEAARAREAARRGDIAEQRGKQFSGSAPSILTPSAAPAPAPNNGTLKVHINAPPGWPVSADARGPFMDGAPRIFQPMPGF
jgi:hypothetical protein